MPRRYPEARKWYRTKEWKRLRDIVLSGNPLCVRCNHARATVVDHRIPHRGNESLFFDLTNLDPMCDHCHNSHKQKIENGRIDTECDEDGYPVDTGHPWNNPK